MRLSIHSGAPLGRRRLLTDRAKPRNMPPQSAPTRPLSSRTRSDTCTLHLIVFLVVFLENALGGVAAFSSCRIPAETPSTRATCGARVGTLPRAGVAPRGAGLLERLPSFGGRKGGRAISCIPMLGSKPGRGEDEQAKDKQVPREEPSNKKDPGPVPPAVRHSQLEWLTLNCQLKEAVRPHRVSICPLLPSCRACAQSEAA